MAKRGDLTLNAETDSSGARFTTRASVTRVGWARTELLNYVRAGVLKQVPGRGPCQLTADSLRAWTARPGSRPARGRERRNPGDVAEARDRSGVFGAEHTGGATARAAPAEFHSIGTCINLPRSRNIAGWTVIRSSSTGCQNIWV